MKKKILFLLAGGMILTSCTIKGSKNSQRSSSFSLTNSLSSVTPSYTLSDTSLTSTTSKGSSASIASQTTVENSITNNTSNTSISSVTSNTTITSNTTVGNTSNNSVTSTTSTTSQNTTSNTTSISSTSIKEDTSYKVRYHLNGGSSQSLTNTVKTSFTINYYNTGYWDYYSTSIFLYDNETENTLGALYSLRIGIDSYNLDNEYIVKKIYKSTESDYKENECDYTIVVHYENVEGYNKLKDLIEGDVIRLNTSVPSSSGSVSISGSSYSSVDIFEKIYDGEVSIGSQVKEQVCSFNFTHYNTGYWDNYKNGIFLYDKAGENALGALYSLRVSMDKVSDNTYLVKHIYSPGDSDKNENPYDYTIVAHEENTSFYSLISKIQVGNYVVINGNIPSSSGDFNVSTNVYTSKYKLTYNEEAKKKGYNFLGYYDNASFSGSPVISFSSNCDLYAKWAKVDEIISNPYTTRSSNTIKAYGNDVSYHQGDITISTYKSNSSFMITRIGYSSSSDVQYVDSKFKEYVISAKNNSVPLGLYIYSKADSTEEAINEANWIISKLEEFGYDKGTFSYPIFMDYEETSSISSRTKASNTSIVNAFANTLSGKGYYPGVYMGGSNYLTYMNVDDIVCDVWIAAYYEGSASSKLSTFFTKYPSNKITMWQFDDGEHNSDSKTGSTLGCSSTYVDQDYVFVDYPSIIKNGHFNGY